MGGDPQGNGAEAARRAGYSPQSARCQARDLLAKPHVREEIERLRRERVALDDLILDGHFGYVTRNRGCS